MSGIGNGDAVRCRITGFEGQVVAVCQWGNGCEKIGVQGTALKDGLPTEVQWFDEQQVQLLAAAPGKHKLVTRKGGPTQDPPRA